MSAADQHVDAFNSKLKQLTRTTISLSKALKAYACINDSERKLSMALNEAPLIGIEIMGPFLEKYAGEIEAHDQAFFVSADFEAEVGPEWAAFKDDIVMVIGRLKELYRKSDARQRKELHCLVEALLMHSRGYNSEASDDPLAVDV